jgi:hypothetical protein
MEMDTDSAYMALSAPLEDIIIPSQREEFYRDWGNWFPKPYCHEHESDFVSAKLRGEEWIESACCTRQRKYDRRTPGLFKVEFEGEGMVALNSKTYCCWDNSTTKVSSKGLSKKLNKFTADTYKKVLFEQTTISGTNKGFVIKENNVYTYHQLRSGLSPFYCKRMVLEDGVNTSPLSI